MKKEPIVIQDQGSFFVGGSIVKGEGTFDPMNPPDCFNPPNPFIPGHPEPPKSGQTLRGLWNRRNIHWYCSMEVSSLQNVGRQHRMAEKVIQISF